MKFKRILKKPLIIKFRQQKNRISKKLVHSEPEGLTEDGKEEPTVILTGFSRGKRITLEQQKSIIKDHFRHGVSVMTENGSAVVIFYGGSLPIPLEEGDLKKCQVNLTIKSWKGN